MKNKLSQIFNNKIKGTYTKDDLNYLYNLGVRNFKTKSFARAISVFLLLTVIEPDNHAYLKALAGSYQANNDFLNAMLTYKYCYSLIPQASNIDCLFYSGVCFYESHDYLSAKAEFEKFLNGMGEHFNELKNQAELYLLSINKLITEDSK